MKNKTLSQSSEDYLEMIYMLFVGGGNVRITDISKNLQVSLPSVTIAIKKLAEQGFVIYEKYGLVRLTKEGTKIAKETYKKHKVLLNFFNKILKVDEKTASEDA